FEPVDILQGILMTVRQLESRQYKLENQYARMVRPEGNTHAINTLKEVFDITDRMWRGIGVIPKSGYELKAKYAKFDARLKFDVNIPEAEESDSCIAGEVMKGIKKPFECPNFGKACKPENPLGAPMVSSEGACAAYYHFSDLLEELETVEP
ncbi:MAG: hydrogenase formation protein HypD, partial [Phaeodactylibacter sp.]|nr:hydrogenase formation protein HypD [Phaeodactylibacter sp.]